jgi:hypothetical protein
MADRTLRRPMFRRGGVANEGIMTGLQDQSVSADPTSGGLNSLVRPGYAEGDAVEDSQAWWKDALDIPPAPYGEMTPEQAEDYLYDYSSLGDAIDTTGQNLLGWSADAAGNYVANPIAHGINWLTGMDIPTPVYNTKQAMIDKWSGTKRDEKGDIIEKEVVGEESETDDGNRVIDETKEVTIGDNTRSSDVKAIYEDILPLLQSTMGVDDSELSRQKYLELAKFGANLMAQPGGSLTRAIGKAAEDPLAGLTRIAETKRKGKKIPAEIAMKIALSEGLSSSELGKQIKDLKKLYPRKKGESMNEWNSRIGDKAMRSGTATKEATAEGRVQNNINRLIESEIFDNEFIAGKVGRAMANTGKDISHFELLPKDKEDYKKGQHYFSKKGKLHLYDGKNVLTWNPSTSKFEE